LKATTLKEKASSATQKAAMVPGKRHNDAAQSDNVERKSVKRDAWERQRCRSHASTMTLEEATLQEKASRMTPGAATLWVKCANDGAQCGNVYGKSAALDAFFFTVVGRSVNGLIGCDRHEAWRRRDRDSEVSGKCQIFCVPGLSVTGTVERSPHSPPAGSFE